MEGSIQNCLHLLLSGTVKFCAKRKIVNFLGNSKAFYIFFNLKTKLSKMRMTLNSRYTLQTQCLVVKHDIYRKCFPKNK